MERTKPFNERFIEDVRDGDVIRIQSVPLFLPKDKFNGRNKENDTLELTGIVHNLSIDFSNPELYQTHKNLLELVYFELRNSLRKYDTPDSDIPFNAYYTRPALAEVGHGIFETKLQEEADSTGKNLWRVVNYAVLDKSKRETSRIISMEASLEGLEPEDYGELRVWEGDILVYNEHTPPTLLIRSRKATRNSALEPLLRIGRADPNSRTITVSDFDICDKKIEGFAEIGRKHPLYRYFDKLLKEAGL